MNYLTVCSGIEAPTVAWHKLGWKPVAFSEIEKFPCAVLNHHYPETPNLGDMTKYADWNPGTFDLLAAGTPCQAFSIAGLRAGLADPRGNLTLVFIAIAAKFLPRWIVWENVPGVLSDATGAFGAFLAGLAKLGYGFAWRILNSRYFGVAQNRRRVFVVAYLGDWRPATAVLFERESLQGSFEASENSREDIAGAINASFGKCGYGAESAAGNHYVIAKNALAKCLTRGGQRLDPETETLIPTIGGFFSDPITFGWQNSSQQGDGVNVDCVPALDKSKVAAVAWDGVRRLTPLEYERLQGFPDNYTLFPYGKGLAKDGPRYKAIGNSMAVPVVEWIGRRIDIVSALMKELNLCT